MELTELARQIARNILLSATEDVEWLTINEMSSDLLAEKGFYLSEKDREDFMHTVDAWISKATVEITFEESRDGS